jgi:radical SAM protein with 4Fe4S-binding SPASM domain
MAYKSVVENTKKEANKVYVINYKGGFSKRPRLFLKKNGIYEVEYVIYGERGLNKAIKYLNLGKNPINLTLIINKKISNKAKKTILKGKKTIKIVDFSKCESNVDFYKSFNKILYKTEKEDTILSTDLMHLYKFFEPVFQCKYSSCLAKNYYVDRKGTVSFCPKYLSKSIVGNIKSEDKYLENEVFVTVLRKAIDKRNICKENCKYYEYCLGGCPLEDGCGDFPDAFIESATYVDNIIKNNKDLTEENYAVSKIIIKDTVYGE